ncbi:vegetative cell wall protein gp1-like [Neltuma alba]|uniref:vegetative cell wall protein gp1-like n=1 Tax=Neltuma alba TaxID=207710 RepID=UPI0010A4DEAE|nr:vegetative cell wall protein gp1-like [Prosopis alba]
MVASLCNNFFAPNTSFSFEDLLSHPPSPPHHEPAPPISPISTSPISASPPVPSTLPPPPTPATLALITVPQSTPSITVSPFAQLPPLPMSITLPSPPSNADKKGEKKSV